MIRQGVPADARSGVHHGEFRDPRLVPVYDAICGWSYDDEFFLSVVRESPGSRVLDLGCGTGRLTIAMAQSGHHVTGVDPASASIAAARAKPGAEPVRWIEGTSSCAPHAAFDIALMTSHVAQFIVDAHEWADALGDIARALAPSGGLVFDTRDPVARAWEHWNPDETRRRVFLPDGSAVIHWTAVESVDDGVVSFRHHYVFADGDERTSTAVMRFRTENELRSSLDAAGFVVDAIYGGWHREPIGEGDGEFIVIARR